MEVEEALYALTTAIYASTGVKADLEILLDERSYRPIQMHAQRKLGKSSHAVFMLGSEVMSFYTPGGKITIRKKEP